MFELPSDLFKWCLKNTTSGSNIFSYDVCFPKYKAASNTHGYLWESYDNRLREIVKVIDRETSVLEVGCGFGHDLVWTATRGARAIGIDVNSTFVDISNLTKTKIEKILGKELDVTIKRTNLLAMNDSEKFDLIFMKDVFHHLEPRERVVKKLVNLLAPKGRLVIVEPNALNPLIQWQMFRIRGFNTVIEKIDKLTGEKYLFGNERLVTGGQICRLFERLGLVGSVSRIRLLPTKLSGCESMAWCAKRLEQFRFEKLLPPACIHTIYMGYKKD
jgi:SAM-dependent methyltransferase